MLLCWLISQKTQSSTTHPPTHSLVNEHCCQSTYSAVAWQVHLYCFPATALGEWVCEHTFVYKWTTLVLGHQGGKNPHKEREEREIQRYPSFLFWASPTSLWLDCHRKCGFGFPDRERQREIEREVVLQYAHTCPHCGDLSSIGLQGCTLFR